MKSYEVANCYTIEGESGECRDVVYRGLHYDKTWAELAAAAERLGIDIPDGEEWFDAPLKGFEENYYIMERVEIDE